MLQMYSHSIEHTLRNVTLRIPVQFLNGTS